MSTQSGFDFSMHKKKKILNSFLKEVLILKLLSSPKRKPSRMEGCSHTEVATWQQGRLEAEGSTQHLQVRSYSPNLTPEFWGKTSQVPETWPDFWQPGAREKRHPRGQSDRDASLCPAHAERPWGITSPGDPTSRAGRISEHGPHKAQLHQHSRRWQLPEEPNTLLSLPPAPQARLAGSDLSEATEGCVYHSDTAEMS